MLTDTALSTYCEKEKKVITRDIFIFFEKIYFGKYVTRYTANIYTPRK